MPFNVLLQFLRERVINFVAISKPALDILNERLAVETGGVVKLSIMPISALVSRHGRFETAVMCAAVENVACLLLLHTYGSQGAVDRTIPVIEARAQDVFYAAYVYTLNYLLVLVMNTAKYLENTVIGKTVLKMKSPSLHLISLADTILSFFFGEDYLMSVINYFKAIPLRVWNYFIRQAEKRVCIPCKKMVHKMQEFSAVVTFLSRRIFEAAVFSVLCMSVVFAFFSVYALDEKPLPIITEMEEHSRAFEDVDEVVEEDEEKDEEVEKYEDGGEGENSTVNDSDVSEDVNDSTTLKLMDSEYDTNVTTSSGDDLIVNTASVEGNNNKDAADESVTGFTNVIATITYILDDFLDEDAAVSVTRGQLEAVIIEASIPVEVVGVEDIKEAIYEEVEQEEVEHVEEEAFLKKSKQEETAERWGEDVEDKREVKEEIEEAVVEGCLEDIGKSDMVIEEEDSEEVVARPEEEAKDKHGVQGVAEEETTEVETSEENMEETVVGLSAAEDEGDSGIPQNILISAVLEVEIPETAIKSELDNGSDIYFDLDKASIEFGRNLFDVDAMDPISISDDRFFLEDIEEGSTLHLDQGAEEIVVTLGDATISLSVGIEEIENSPDDLTDSISDMGTPSSVVGVIESFTGTLGPFVSDIEGQVKETVITKEVMKDEEYICAEVLADNSAAVYSFHFDGDSGTVDFCSQEFFQFRGDAIIERGCDAEEIFRLRDQAALRNSNTTEFFHVHDFAVSTRDSSDIVDASFSSSITIDGITVDVHPPISLLVLDSVAGELCTAVEEPIIAVLQDGQDHLLAKGTNGNSVHEPVQKDTPEAAVFTSENFGPFVGPSPQNSCQHPQDGIMMVEIETRCDSSHVASYEDSKTVLCELDEVEEILTQSISAFKDVEAKASMMDSPVPEGTLVGVGVAREGFIFSDSQDLKDIAEMETERRCLIRLGKRRAACGDEKVPREDASEVLASVQRTEVGFALDLNEGGSNLLRVVPSAGPPRVDNLGISCCIGVAGKHGIIPLDSLSRLPNEEDIHTDRISIDLEVDLAEGLIDDHLSDVKESILISTSPIIVAEDAVELSEVKCPRIFPVLHSHNRMSSLDALVGMDSSAVAPEATSSIFVPKAESAMLRGKFASKFSFRALAAPFIPKFSEVRAPGSENTPKVPAHWTPAPVIPVVLEAPRRRRVQSASRRSRHLSLMGNPLKDRPTKP